VILIDHNYLKAKTVETAKLLREMSILKHGNNGRLH
jgi:hypothetical protein